jgi:hypothetical protein
MAACARRSEGVAAGYQRRSTQSWVKISRSVGAAAGAPQPAPPGGTPKAGSLGANEAGNADQADGGDKRVHVCGRSRAIHACLVGS